VGEVASRCDLLGHVPAGSRSRIRAPADRLDSGGEEW
jgi:hypothetical protein